MNIITIRYIGVLHTWFAFLRPILWVFLLYFSSITSVSAVQTCTPTGTTNLNIGGYLLSAIPEDTNFKVFEKQIDLSIRCTEVTPIMLTITSALAGSDPNLFSVALTNLSKEALGLTLTMLPMATVDGRQYALAPIGDVTLSSITAASTFRAVSGEQNVPGVSASVKNKAWTQVDTGNGEQIVSGRNFVFPIKITMKPLDSSNGWRNEIATSGGDLFLSFGAIASFTYP